MYYTSISYETGLQKTFQDAGDAIKEDKYIVHSTCSESESELSDNEESNMPEETFEECMEILSGAIQNLLDLGPRPEEPIPDPPTEVPPTSANTVFGNAQYFTNRVLEKFPKCQPTLAIALGKANWDSIERNAKKKESALDVQTEEVLTDQATTLFLDSGLGSSVPSTNTDTMTILSYGEGGEVRARIPQLPRNIKEGQLFPCIACGKHIVKRGMKMWKRHLLTDLRPWVCCQISCPCDHKPFPTREEWVGHLRRNHTLHPVWDDKNCPICLGIVSDGGLAMISHIERHLEEISLAVLPCDPDDSEENTTDTSQSDLVAMSDKIPDSVRTTGNTEVDSASRGDSYMVGTPGIRCPSCQGRDQEVWILPGRECPYYGTYVPRRKVQEVRKAVN